MSCNCKNRPNIEHGIHFCQCDEQTTATASQGCYKLHEYDWLEEFPDNEPSDLFEVRFKNTRRSFFQNVNNLELSVGDIVAVEGNPGHDIGVISLKGDMVQRQIRRTGFTPYNGEHKKIYRKAKAYDIEKWQEAISLEHETMILSRQIAADMGLNMKIGDVEYQGDRLKATFYYIADVRVDFRELIKVFAERFRVRIEMKQIGARQEAGRIGGIGACGRELCCASWISNFTSVTTNAARLQDISLNPQKLAGQCSKLKCCMMYEYDTYVDARKSMPYVREPLQAMDGEYHLVKSDVLAQSMSFSTTKDAFVNVVTIPASRVREIISANRKGRKVEQLEDSSAINSRVEEPTFKSEEDSITRFDESRGTNKKRGRNQRRERKPQQDGEQKGENQTKQHNAEGKANNQRRANGNESKGERPARPQGEQRQQRPQGEQRQARPQSEQNQPKVNSEAQGEQRVQGDKPRRRFNRKPKRSGNPTEAK
ncbi:MAG: regulatory iron-sulfur-containing complex subunit RicT [Rikenellaceae bacterium]